VLAQQAHHVRQLQRAQLARQAAQPVGALRARRVVVGVAGECGVDTGRGVARAGASPQPQVGGGHQAESVGAGHEQQPLQVLRRGEQLGGAHQPPLARLGHHVEDALEALVAVLA